MRWLLLSMMLLPALIGCGPNRKVEKGNGQITTVETIAAGNQKIVPSAGATQGK